MKNKNRQCSNTIDPNVALIEISGEPTDTGTDALYFELGTRPFAVKLYSVFDYAMIAYSNQKLIARLHRAPATGRFLMATFEDDLYFGYETKRAIPVNQHDALFKDQFWDLLSLLKRHGMAGDFRPSNCGEHKGRLVAIDLGRHCQKWDCDISKNLEWE